MDTSSHRGDNGADADADASSGWIMVASRKRSSTNVAVAVAGTGGGYSNNPAVSSSIGDTVLQTRTVIGQGSEGRPVSPVPHQGSFRRPVYQQHQRKNLCDQFMIYGTCRFGSRCRFVHEYGVPPPCGGLRLNGIPPNHESILPSLSQSPPQITYQDVVRRVGTVSHNEPLEEPHLDVVRSEPHDVVRRTGAEPRELQRRLENVESRLSLLDYRIRCVDSCCERRHRVTASRIVTGGQN